ncbi:MAG: hypothetical protein ACU4EQ_13100 [Candidatus Nitrosoglobus sp.]|jgi:hypothetical protein
MKAILKILIFAVLLATNSAFAITLPGPDFFTPENGWWWSPQESGMGFNLESQNGKVFIATYVYDSSGKPLWYSGSGELDYIYMTVTIHLQLSQNGPCPTCPYQSPTTSDASLPITLQFTSKSKGSVSWQGKTTPIKRFNFNHGTGIQRLIGEWVLMTTKPVPYEILSQGKKHQINQDIRYQGFRIIFDSVQQEQGELIVVGKIPGVPDAKVTASAFNQYGYQYAVGISNKGVATNEGVNFSGLNKFTNSGSFNGEILTGGPFPFEAYRVK